jgi:hypothetical protein
MTERRPLAADCGKVGVTVHFAYTAPLAALGALGPKRRKCRRDREKEGSAITA